VVGGLTFATVSTGDYWSNCGLTTGAAAYCWGANDEGELGIGSAISSSSTPLAVAGGLTYMGISVGEGYACGVATGGAAYCWGWNQQGQLGDGTTIERSSPTPVAGGLKFVAVGAGEVQSCGLTVGGAAYCWGNDWFGQLGDGRTATESFAPVRVVGPLTFAQLSVGHLHACGVTTVGVVYCWGWNDQGQLGNGTTTNSATPVKVAGQP
jgi:alpha-tubulin suppressor-like RCC1 family protein